MNFITINIQKVNYLTCNDWVIELPLFKTEVETVRRWSTNSLYILLINSGIEFKVVSFSPNILDEINKAWNNCISNNLDYMKLK